MALKAAQQSGKSLKQLLGCAERRRRKRVGMNVPTKVKGSNVQGNPFEEQTESLDVSSKGVAFFLKQRVRLRLTWKSRCPGRIPHMFSNTEPRSSVLKTPDSAVTR